MEEIKLPITYEDVVRVAAELTQSGARLTILSVREKLGRGSFSTIKKHLARMESEQRAPAEAPVPPQLESLWNEARRAAQDALARDREDLRALSDELDERLARMQTALDAATRARELAEVRLADRSAELGRATDQIVDLRGRLDRAEQREAALSAELVTERDAGALRLQEMLSSLADLQNSITRLQASQTATSDLVSASARAAITSVSEFARAEQDSRRTSLEMLRRDLKRDMAAALSPLASVPASMHEVERLMRRMARAGCGRGKGCRRDHRRRGNAGHETG